MSGLKEIHQLPTGEIASYSPGADGRLAYRRSLSASIAMHEALACFDPSCLPAVRIRQRIREFLAWQELADHLWREDGKHGEMPADPALSAAAALALMDNPARAPWRWSLYVRALDRFRGPDGLYRTEAAGADPVVNARVATYLAVAGEDVEALTTYLRREADEAPTVELACAAARCWARAHLPGRRQLAATLEPVLLERLRGTGAADAAGILLALLDLGSTSPEIVPATHRMLAELPMTAGADRCPSLTWALVMAAAARSQTLSKEDFPCTSLAS